MKWGSPLFSKLKKEYWKKKQIEGIPLVFAIHDFHAVGSMTWSFPALSDCLYGIRCDDEGKDCPVTNYSWGEKTNIPAGFFRQKESENVSAVLASNEATLTKFNRMGQIADFGDPRIFIGRFGALIDISTEEGGAFRYAVKPGEVTEKWSSGLWVFHNQKLSTQFRKVLFQMR